MLAFRSLFKKKQSNYIKIASLGLGLAVGLILITKALFELSYDNFYPDSENIYIVQQRIQRGNEAEKKYPQTSGGVAPGMKVEIPEVLDATRFTWFEDNAVFYTESKNRLVGTIVLADSCFFDVVPRPMVAGNAKEVLSRPMYALISDNLAKKMGTDVVGQSITLDSYPGQTLTIGGVFEALPFNSSFKLDILVSLSSISRFMWDGTDNWFGNDRYMSFVKLLSGIDPSTLAPAIRQMQEKYQDISKIEEQYGAKIGYSFIPLTKYHSSQDDIKRKVKLLNWIAFALIFTAMMNYVLFVISAHVKRAKEMAVYKSFGANNRNISQLIYSETFIHLLAALCVAALALLLFRPVVEELLGTSVPALLSGQSCIVLLILVIVIFVVTGILPAKLFSSIPVATAFRSYRQSRRSWMLALFFVQLAAATFLITLLVIIGLQYRLMLNDHPGYVYENTAYCPVDGTTDAQRITAMEALERLPDVQAVATADCLLFEWASGNNIRLPGSDKELFNMADLYGIDERYLSLMEIPIIEGSGFYSGVSTEEDMIVSHSFAQRICEMTLWSDGVVGKELMVSEHGLCRVVGVYNDVRVGVIGAEEKRPSAMFYTPEPEHVIFIRFHKLSGEGLQKAMDVLQSAIPDKDIVVTPYRDGILEGYNELRLFRNSVMVGSIIALALSLIGLLAYLRSEINRRSAEIAIRKVNGATIANVLILFAQNVFYLSIPALVAGAMVAAFVSGKMMENFSKKIDSGIMLYGVCSVAVLVVTLGIITAGCWRVATQNPVHSLKTE